MSRKSNAWIFYVRMSRRLNYSRQLRKVLLARRLLLPEIWHEPANVLTPVKLAEAAEQAGTAHGFEVTIYDERQIKEIGMKAFWKLEKPRSILRG